MVATALAGSTVQRSVALRVDAQEVKVKVSGRNVSMIAVAPTLPGWLRLTDVADEAPSPPGLGLSGGLGAEHSGPMTAVRQKRAKIP